MTLPGLRRRKSSDPRGAGFGFENRGKHLQPFGVSRAEDSCAAPAGGSGFIDGVELFQKLRFALGQLGKTHDAVLLDAAAQKEN